MPSTKTKRIGLILGGIGLLIAAVGVVVTLFLQSQPQDNRQQAAVEGGTAHVRITPTTKTLGPNESTTATVSFNTNGTWIESISVQLQFAYTQDEAPLTISELEVEQALEATGRFNCLEKTIDDTSNPVTVDFACTAITGYANETFTDLFSITLTAGPDGADNPVTIEFTPEQTVISNAGDDVAAIPDTKLVVTLTKPAEATQKKMTITSSAQCNPSELSVEAELSNADDEPLSNVNVSFELDDQDATDTTDTNGVATAVFPYETAGTYVLKVTADGFSPHSSNVQIDECAAATPTPTPTPTATPTPTPAATYSCNSVCSTDSDCSYGNSCYSGVCRSDSCPSDATCQCNTSEVASASGATELPVTGSFDRTIAMILIGGLLTFGGIQVLLGRKALQETE